MCILIRTVISEGAGVVLWDAFPSPTSARASATTHVLACCVVVQVKEFDQQAILNEAMSRIGPEAAPHSILQVSNRRK